MADAVTDEPAPLAAWEASDVGLGEVERALEGLRHGEERAATRTSVVTLVVVAPDDDRAARACSAMHRLGARHPGRTIVVVPNPSGSGVDARVTLHAGELEGHVFWSEEMVLHVRGPATAHLDSLIEPFTLPELPVAVWYVDALPDVGDPLAAAASALLVDARQMAGGTPASGGSAVSGRSLARLGELVRRYVVVDLSWVRLGPWREILAGLFTGQHSNDVYRVSDAAVSGRTGPRDLIGGWLLDRLGLAPARVQLHAADHVKIELGAGAAPNRSRYCVERREGEHVVRAHVASPAGVQQSQLLALPDDSVPWSLGTALGRLRRDPVYEHAVQAAVALTA